MQSELRNMKIEMNTSSLSENVPEIERQICVIKDIERSYHHNIKFKHAHKVILVAMLINFSMLIKNFPSKGGVYKSVIHHTILAGVKFDYDKNCQIQLGHYTKISPR